MNEQLKALMEEFQNRKGVEQLRNALRTRADISDTEIVYQRLAENLDYERRRRGLILGDIETSSKAFDYGNGAGFMYSAKFEGLDKDAKPIVFVADHYNKLAMAAQKERDAVINLIESLLKKRKVSTIRKAIRERLK